MKRLLASLCVCWAGFCNYPSNTAPLEFGMTPEQAALALGVPIFYYSGPPSAEIYVTTGSATVPGFYPVGSALALQFRNGVLTGWKKDWELRRVAPF